MASASPPVPTIGNASARIVGVLLAGGQSRRLGGGDKCLMRIGGRPMLARVVERVRPQVSRLVLSANGDPSRFADFGLPVIPDPPGRSVGPLGGILAGMFWAREHVPHAQWIVSVPTDAPFLPRDLVARLAGAITAPVTIAAAQSRDRVHPVVAIWPVQLADDLGDWLDAETQHSVRAWLARNASVAVPFDEAGCALDPFFNVNTPEDASAAAQLAEECA